MNVGTMIELAHAVKKVTDETDAVALRGLIEVLRLTPSEATAHLNGNDWRFIREDEIQEVLAQELSNDTYILGCFKDYFLSEATDIPVDLIATLQEAEKFESLGEYIKGRGLVPKIAENYSRYDGYGPHFSSYDGEEHEVSYFDPESRKVVTYYAFNCG